MGTPFELDMNGKVLFIEDINEYLYKVDRIMYQLKLGDKLSRLKRPCGRWVYRYERQYKSLSENLLKTLFLMAVEAYDFPVCFNFPAGHGAENVALSFGEKYRLKVAEDECKLNKI